jgi:hypothetical protein
LSLVAFLAAAPTAGAAEFGFAPGGLRFEMLNAEGAPEDRAGSHPDRLRIEFALKAEGGALRDLIFELPPGFGGAANAVLECPRSPFEEGVPCPEESQVGTVTLDLAGQGSVELPLFQLEPASGELLSFSSLPGLDAPLKMQLRPTDFGISLEANDLPEVEVEKGSFELWGIPADHQEGTSIPRRALLTAPTRCGLMTATMRLRAWQEGAQWLSESASSGAPLAGCESLAFEPQLAMQLSNSSADSPTGARLDLILPANDDPDGQAPSQVRDMTIQMPAGVTVSPDGAAGFVACRDEEFGLGNSSEPRCPPASKIGTVELATASSPDPLVGTLYAGQEHPGERFRLLVVASGPGLVAKFIGTLRPDLATGRLATSMENLPQVPIERMTLNLDGGGQPLLASPLECGTFAANGSFVPWGGGAAVAAAASVTIAAGAEGSACAPTPPFSPQLTVSSSNQRAGRPTTIAMTLWRRPGEQLPRRFAIALPRGLSAVTRGVDLCPEPAVGAGACPASSRIGSASAEVGSSANPVPLDGDVYLGGPYRRAPFSFVMVIRARLGPFELGSSSMRSALRIDPRSGRITVESDPLPGLIEGVPVRFRTVRMALDRAGAIRNPTSCARATVDATVESAAGGTAAVRRDLPVTGCRKLKFKPRFAMALTGGSRVRAGGRPGLRIFARMRPGDTALRSLRFSLPDALKFRLSGLGEICSRPDARDGLCGRRARVGSARARALTLGEELKGSVYVVQPPDEGLPELWVSAAAGGMRMSMRGRTSVSNGRFVANMAGLPDVPLSKFTMTLRGGRNGTLVLGAAACAKGKARPLPFRGIAQGQNGALRKLRSRATAPCGAAD